MVQHEARTGQPSHARQGGGLPAGLCLCKTPGLCHLVANSLISRGHVLSRIVGLVRRSGPDCSCQREGKVDAPRRAGILACYVPERAT